MKLIYNSEYDYLTEHNSEYKINKDKDEFVIYGIENDLQVNDLIRVEFDDNIFYTCEVLRQYKNKHRYNTYKMRIV